jgi:hypothetical protein
MPEKIISDIENLPELRRQAIEDLLILRDDYKNEIPREILHSTSSDNKYKVRKSWFQGLVAVAENRLMKGLIREPNLVKDIDAFIVRYTSPDWAHPAVLTTKEDIEKADNLIDKILENLMKQNA